MSPEIRRAWSLENGWLRWLRSMLPHRIVQPVFVIAPPRSGSTMLFECLAELSELTAFTHREGDHLWQRVLPYSRRSDPSDRIGPADLDVGARRRLRAWMYVEATRSTARRRQQQRSLSVYVGRTPIRYLDKTIANCFRLDTISTLFPDVLFVFLVRDPRPNIASMIAGWDCKKQFGRDAVEDIVRASHTRINHWAYAAPPGWREVLPRPLAEICAWSWAAHVGAMLEHAERAPRQVIWVRYEELLAEPHETAAQICAHLSLSDNNALAHRLRHAPPSRTTVSPARRDKWLDYRSAVLGALPIAEKQARLVGYDLTTPVVSSPNQPARGIE